ncbi:hypothetical protein K4K52_008644 [Colletotrichum sp. SAR 10_76]|nr:hypothetical protein K4K52_008644 [Colletotrichum sp. SAR 10_76]
MQHKQWENKVISLIPSAEELASGEANAPTVGAAVSILQRDGIVVINDVVDPAHCDNINDLLSKESEALATDNSTHFNFGAHTRNISQPPPLDVDYLYSDIWANRFTNKIISNVLGPNPVVSYVNGNTALPSADNTRQEVHADVAYAHVNYPFGLVANYYLVDTDVENGSTEVWIGSHRDTSMEDHIGVNKPAIKDECLEERRKYMPPIQPRIKKGSVVIRDIRLWHAGMPNRSSVPRIMLAIGYTPWYMNSRPKVTLPVAAKELVTQWETDTGVTYRVDFVEGDLDHKKTVFKTGFRPNNPHIVYPPGLTKEDYAYLALDDVPLAA